jgi:hypothetical protein
MAVGYINALLKPGRGQRAEGRWGTTDDNDDGQSGGREVGRSGGSRQTAVGTNDEGRRAEGQKGTATDDDDGAWRSIYGGLL